MRRISNKAITGPLVLDSLNREIVPAIRGIQAAIIAIEGTSIVDLDARLDAVEADIVAIETDVSAAEADIVAIETDVADHETRISTLEGEESAFKTTGYSGKARGIQGTANATYYLWPVGYENGSAVTQIVIAQAKWPRSGTIRNLRYQNLNPFSETDTFSFTLNVNGSDKALTITGISPNTAGEQSDLDPLHAVHVDAGDLVAFKVLIGGAAITSTGVEPTWCFDFEDDG